jgi:hypothetical protein
MAYPTLFHAMVVDHDFVEITGYDVIAAAPIDFSITSTRISVMACGY